jgi:hypothetical protein
MNLTELEALLDTTDAESSAPITTSAPVKLVPKVQEPPFPELATAPQAVTLQERLQEIELAQKLGYLLCKCTWPPQIMVLTGADHVYRCRRCSRVREM